MKTTWYLDRVAQARIWDRIEGDVAECPWKSSEGLADMRHFSSQAVSYRRFEERSNALVRLFTCL
jgi:hypothetical protein